MKHVFIINPAAGPTDATNIIKENLSKLPTDIDYEIYTTSGPVMQHVLSSLFVKKALIHIDSMPAEETELLTRL